MLMRLRRRVNGEEGIALITVILVTMVMLILLASTMAAAVNSLPLSRHDQDWSAALPAAEAGIDDYVARLNQNDQYYKYGTASTSSTGGACYSSSDPSTTYTLTLPAPDGNAAFTGWVAVPGSSNQWYRYTVDTSCLASQGAIILTVSGRGGVAAAPKGPASVRTIRTTIRRRTFLNYIYFTDFETTDPALYPTGDSTAQGWDEATATTNCAKYLYAGRNSHCQAIYFAKGDVISGPLHTNDEIQVSCGNPGPAFQGTTTTSWNDPAKKFWVGTGSCSGSSAPSFTSGSPSFVAPLTLPPTNVALEAQADATVGGTGCLYTGPTSIQLLATGKMNVTSPYTKAIGGPNNCATGNNVSLPGNGVVYVQGVPTDSSDYNYSASDKTHTQLNGTATLSHPLGYPQRYDTTTYGGRDGDVFLSGVLNGRLTIAADNNINVVDDVTYNNAATDMLGLVANNFVQTYNPVGLSASSYSSSTTYGSGDQVSSSGSVYTSLVSNNRNHTPSSSPTYWSLVSDNTPSSACDGSFDNNNYCNLKRVTTYTSPGSAFNDPVINAAILAVNHSFRVQNYDKGGSLGTLHVFGAIAQRFRGIVGLIGSTGYLKDYNYDTRLKYQSPPYFIDPVASAWQTVLWAEQAPAFSSTAT
jgi:Tfp pilus assembly protein PilX